MVCTNSFWNTNTNDYELDPNKPQTKKYYYFVDRNSVKVFRIKGNDINSYRRDYTLHKTDEVRINGDITLDRETLKARISWFGSTYLCEVMVLKGKF